MKKLLIFSCVLLSTFSHGVTVLRVKLHPYFTYEQSMYSCEHQGLPGLPEFIFVGNVENAKLTEAVLTAGSGYFTYSKSLSAAEVSASLVELDFMNQWFLSRLTLDTETLYWVFANIGGSFPQAPELQHCPPIPFNSVLVDPAVPQFNFTGFNPGLGIRYAPAVTFHGTRQIDRQFLTYRASLGFSTEFWP